MFVVVLVGEGQDVRVFGPFESFEVAHAAELELHRLAPFNVTDIIVTELKKEW